MLYQDVATQGMPVSTGVFPVTTANQFDPAAELKTICDVLGFVTSETRPTRKDDEASTCSGRTIYETLIEEPFGAYTEGMKIYDVPLPPFRDAIPG